MTAVIATGRPAAAQTSAPRDAPGGGGRGGTGLASTAGANPPPGNPSWYGYQILMLDALSVAGVFWASGSEQYGVGFGASATLFSLGGPTVHLIHGHPIRGAASLGIRTVGPILCSVVGAVMAQAAAGPQDNDDAFPAWFGGAALGLSLGILGAILVDDIALAWDDPAPPDAPRPVSRAPTPAWAPKLTWMRDREHGERATLGVVATF